MIRFVRYLKGLKLYYKNEICAMKVMGHTITGAASGETTSVWRRRIHNLRQKNRREL